MKSLKNIWRAFARIPYIKYIVVLVVAVGLLGFFGPNSLLAHLSNKKRISELNDEIEVYNNAEKHSQDQIRQLRTNPKAMEKIARERYFMKHADEDIFVLSDDQKQLNTAVDEKTE